MNDLLKQLAALVPQSGVELVAAERQRQIQEECWSPEHDDQHTKGEIGRAAIAYVFAACVPMTMHEYTWWPWPREWFKPGVPRNAIRNLVKAGALIAAEIDRLQRIDRTTMEGAQPNV